MSDADSTRIKRSPSIDDKLSEEKGQDGELSIAQEVEDPNLDKNTSFYDDDSPYPEVRSAVANTDDPSMPVSTIRSWTIGLIFAIVIAGINQFFYFRYPTVIIMSTVPQLLTFPVGRLWASVMPNVRIFGLQLNPGPFTVKEHVLATIMASVSSQSSYATDVIAVQRVFYGQTYPFSYQWLLVMSTQLIGFSIGGVAKRFLVQPQSMIWPANLVNCALFNTLHSQQYAGIGNRGGISRERFFLYAFLGSAAWYFIPGYLFQALSIFSWVCWIAPDNVKLNQLFGYQNGLGMSLITFDWSQIAYIGSPLATPWWAEANTAAAFVLFFWVLAPILHFSNVWFGNYLPMSSRLAFNNVGTRYNVKEILKADATLDLEKYQNYSPLFLSTTGALAYGLSFASITSTITHTFFYYRKQIWTQSRLSMDKQTDIHARLMSVYRQVPEWWYACVLVSMFAFGVVAIEVWPTQFPVWAFVVALLLAFVFVIPIGMIQAITNQQVGLNVVSELIVGYMLPGRPIAMMLFKTWGYFTMYQALQFISDFKLGHYMKVPPRAMFLGQLIASVLAGTVQLGVQAWMFTNIEDFCGLKQKDGFICPGTQTFATSSIVWGVIGPARQFSKGQIFYGLIFFFLIGAILPGLGYAATRRYPNSFFRYVNFPVMFSGTGQIPPATAVNYVPWAIVGFIFQYVVRRRHFQWWTKYNYVLSAALDSGTAVSILLIFFCLQYPKNGTIGLNTVQAWWGNTVFGNTADALASPLKTLAPGETFGPSTW